MRFSAAGLLDNDKDFIPLIPRIEEVITGKENIYTFLKINSLYHDARAFLPTPLSGFLLSLYISHYHYEIATNEKTLQVIQYIHSLQEAELKTFFDGLQEKIQQKSVMNAMKCHVWNDTHALLAHTDSPFKPVFEPQKIIDCKGIKAIEEKPYVKSHFLREINHHLTLSPQERAELLQSFSLVRSITAEDCQKDKLSPVLIGQLGVFARIDLPKYFFLGFYSGFYFADTQTAYNYFNSVGHGIDVYLFGHQNQTRPLISAYRSGNRISLINSATDYTGTAEQIAHQLFYVQNTLPLDLKTDNNPNSDIQSDSNMFDISGYTTIRDVRAGEQLFVDYGYDYWYNRKNKLTSEGIKNTNIRVTATLAEIDDAYMVLKKNIQ